MDGLIRARPGEACFIVLEILLTGFVVLEVIFVSLFLWPAHTHPACRSALSAFFGLTAAFIFWRLKPRGFTVRPARFTTLGIMAAGLFSMLCLIFRLGN